MRDTLPKLLEIIHLSTDFLEVSQTESISSLTGQSQHLRLWSGFLKLCLFLGSLASLEVFYRPLHYPSQPLLCGILFLNGHPNKVLPRMKHKTEVWDIDYGAEPQLKLQKLPPDDTYVQLISDQWQEQWDPWQMPMCLSKYSTSQSITHVLSHRYYCFPWWWWTITTELLRLLLSQAAQLDAGFHLSSRLITTPSA